MLTLSYTAGELLDQLLAEANAPDDAAVRLFSKAMDLASKSTRPDDTTFDHKEKVVLAIDGQVSELLADMKLDVKVTGEGPERVLLEE